MFIIAGLSPRLKIVENTPRICPSCGLAQAYLKRADSYFSLFFIPLFRVKKGEPFVFCERCKSVMTEGGTPRQGWKAAGAGRCSACGRSVDREFVYCPYCGKKV